MLSKKEQKYIKSLKVKKYRLREKRFLVEGAKNILELVASDFKIDTIISTEDFSQSLVSHSKDIRIESVSGGLLSQLGTFKTNEAGIAVVRQKEMAKFNPEIDDHLFVLDGVGDPGNLGTIIRTLDWFGYKKLLCSEDCAEFYHPKTIASTMGSFSRLEVFYGNLNSILSNMSAPIFGADAGGMNIYKSDFEKPSVIVMGSESHGISPDVQKLINQTIAIPKVGNAESLNVGIATGIIAGYLRSF